MSMKTPDWYRRLRALEQRIDNQSTDIARLWNWMPQMPEEPGHFMPQIVAPDPSSTTTTTSTSTTSTTTTGTTTTSTTTTVPPLTCRSGWPSSVTLSASGFTGVNYWMNPGLPVNVNGMHVLTHFNCSLIAPTVGGGTGTGRYIWYKGPLFSAPGGSFINIQWSLSAALRKTGMTTFTGIYGPTIEFDQVGILAWVNAAFGVAMYYGHPNTPPLANVANTTGLSPTSPVGASILCGRSFSLQLVNSAVDDDWYTWPSSIAVQFASTSFL